MSSEADAWVRRLARALVPAFRDVPLSAMEVHVLRGLAANHHHQYQAVWLKDGLRQLAAECRITERSAIRAINGLEDKGLLHVSWERGPGGRFTSVYRYHGLDPIPPGATRRRAGGRPPANGKPAPAAESDDTESTGGDDAMSSRRQMPQSHLSVVRVISRDDSDAAPPGARATVTTGPTTGPTTPSGRGPVHRPWAAPRCRGGDSLALPRDDLATAMLKWDGGRAPEIPEAVTRFLWRHGQFVQGGVTAEELDRRGKALQRAHPHWLVNSTTILNQGHTVLRPPAPVPPQGGVDPPPVAVAPPRVEPPSEAERAAAGRARELLRMRFPRLGAATPANLPGVPAWAGAAP